MWWSDGFLIFMLVISTNAAAATSTHKVWDKPLASTLTNEVPLVKVDAKV